MEKLILPIALAFFLLAYLVSASASSILEGDVTGATDDNTVVAIQGKSVPESGSALQCLGLSTPSADSHAYFDCGAGEGIENAYANITDGTNTANASGAATFALLSANALLDIEVGNGSPDAATFTIDSSQEWTGNAGTATALAANGANCSSGQYPLGVDASGAVESCTVVYYQTIQDEDSGLTQRAVLNFEGAGVECADDTTKTTCTIAGGSGVADLNDLSDVTLANLVDADLFIYDSGTSQWTNAALSGDATISDTGVITVSNAGTADALTNNPTDCPTNEFATAIAANGDLTCAGITNADVPDDITIDLAATATALAANPTDCTIGQFAHTIAANGDLTCSEVGIGDTDLVADRGLTLNGATISADEKLYTIAHSFMWPLATTTNDDNPQWLAPHALTLTRVDCSTNTGTLTIQLEERTLTTPNATGTSVLTSSLVCDSDNQSTTAFDNPGIAQNRLVNLTVTGVSGSPTMTRIHFRGIYD